MMAENSGENRIKIVEPARADRFFLSNILNARIELDLETGCHGDDDQDTNVYLAGLFDAMVSGQQFTRSPDYLSPYESDIIEYLEEHPGTRNEYIVYKGNADYGLMSTGVFNGHTHEGSYHKRVIGESDDPERIAFHYRLAGSALGHLRGPRASLVHTFEALAEHVRDFIQIVRKVSIEYFEMMDRISDGSIYHLEKEIELLSQVEAYGQLLDEFLALYSRYRKDPVPEDRSALIELAGKLKRANPGFSFDPGGINRDRCSKEE